MEHNRPRCEECNKETYLTSDDARAELERILTTQKKLTDVKPCRFFECKCGYFCLTSKPKIHVY